MRRAGSQRSRVGAFTLVELLVVVGIIGVLIGLLLPSLNRALEQSRRTGCLANLRSLGQALTLYATTNRDRLPNGNPRGVWVDYNGSNRVMVKFAGGVEDARVFYCPSDKSDVPKEITTADPSLPNSARVSYDFFSLYFPPEHGPVLSRLRGSAPLAWDLEGGSDLPRKEQNHGSRGGHVLFADGHAAWADLAQWDDTNWPKPAKQFYPKP